MSNPFTSFKRPATKDEIAASLTHDTIDEIEALRKGRESEPHTPEEAHLIERLGVLMAGPRKDAVIPVVRERWPQMAQLLDRTVGVVEACHFDGGQIVYGIIRGIDGESYKFTERDATEAGLVPDSTAQVTFLPTEDGMARNIQVIA